MITRSEVRKYRAYQAGISIFGAELVVMIFWGAITRSFSPTLIAISFATVFTAWLCTIDSRKAKVLYQWQKLDLPLGSFPVTEDERKAVTPIAQKLLLDLADKATKAKDEQFHLLREKDALDTKYTLGFRGVEKTAARRDVQWELIKTEEALSEANRVEESSRNRYLLAWNLFTKAQADGGAGISPNVGERFEAGTLQLWVADLPSRMSEGSEILESAS